MSATTFEADLERRSATWSALGCVVRLVVTDPEVVDWAAGQLAEELAAIDRACSRFRVDSELMQVPGARGARVDVSPLFGAALAVALHAAEVTNGLVDPTLAGTIAAFGYDRDFDDLPAAGPMPVEVLASPSRWREICLANDQRSVVVPAGVQLDLGATAKALAADRAATRLAEACGCGVLVGLGGDIAVAGAAPVGGWAVRVQESPGPLEQEPSGGSGRISLVDGALATSSIQHRRWQRGGRSYHHIIDPRTARPASSPLANRVGRRSHVRRRQHRQHRGDRHGRTRSGLAQHARPAGPPGPHRWPGVVAQRLAGRRTMITALAAPSEATSLWYLTRGTGTVALVLLTAVLVLGVLARAGGALPACPRFVTPALHRNLSLLAVALIAVHVTCAVVDPYAPIRLVDAVVPFVSAYRPIWLGLGALTFDILIAVIVTSLLRVRLGHRAWRAVHWAAYASWPLAVAHGLGSGSDARTRWLLAIMATAGALALAAVLWRATGIGSTRDRRRWVAVSATVMAPLALAGFAVLGPLAPHWAARAGTPMAQRAATPIVRIQTSTVRTGVQPVAADLRHGVATFKGESVVRHPGHYVVVFAGTLHGGPLGRITITLTGRPAPRGRIDLTAGTVVYTVHHTRGWSSYRGVVTSIRNHEVGATLAGPGGRVQMRAHLTVASSQAFTGRVRLS